MVCWHDDEPGNTRSPTMIGAGRGPRNGWPPRPNPGPRSPGGLFGSKGGGRRSPPGSPLPAPARSCGGGWNPGGGTKSRPRSANLRSSGDGGPADGTDHRGQMHRRVPSVRVPWCATCRSRARASDIADSGSRMPSSMVRPSASNTDEGCASFSNAPVSRNCSMSSAALPSSAPAMSSATVCAKRSGGWFRMVDPAFAIIQTNSAPATRRRARQAKPAAIRPIEAAIPSSRREGLTGMLSRQ